MAVEQPTERTVDQTDRFDHCRDCGQPIQGITATKPGTHEFVGCGHSASSHRL